VMPALIRIARQLLEDHQKSWQIPSLLRGPLEVSSDPRFR
jgi:hypothetical protein